MLQPCARSVGAAVGTGRRLAVARCCLASSFYYSNSGRRTTVAGSGWHPLRRAERLALASPEAATVTLAYCDTRRHGGTHVATTANASSVPRVTQESLLEDRRAKDRLEAASAGVPQGVDGVELAKQTEELFCNSVLARTVSNSQLRKFIGQLNAKDCALALAAVSGARRGGLRIDPQSSEVLLSKLMDGGQIRAGMEVYQTMIREHKAPTPSTYDRMMEMCLFREMAQACQTLFDDMSRRGQSPTARSYELVITSLALEDPPKWEKAIQIFDKLTRNHEKKVTAATYNALMRVYMKMSPFDWRVVYNCYLELRSKEPRVQLQWESYLIVSEALVRGRAGLLRRALTFIDAWFAVTHIRSKEFLIGVLVYLGVALVIKSIIGVLVKWYYDSSRGSGVGVNGAAESMLPP